MTTGDLICSCCGSYQRCNCRQPQATFGGFNENRIADALEKLVELLEKSLKEPQCEETGTYHHFVDGQCTECGYGSNANNKEGD